MSLKSRTMSKTLHIAIIGCGRVAGHHCSSIGNADGVALAAVCDLVEEKAAAYGKDVRIGGGVSTVRAFLEADLIDTIQQIGYDATLPSPETTAVEQQDARDAASVLESEDLARKALVSLALGFLAMMVSMPLMAPAEGHAHGAQRRLLPRWTASGKSADSPLTRFSPLVVVRDSSAMRTKSFRIPSRVSSSTISVPVRPPASPVATTGSPRRFKARATLMPLPPVASFAAVTKSSVL